MPSLEPPLKQLGTESLKKSDQGWFDFYNERRERSLGKVFEEDQNPGYAREMKALERAAQACRKDNANMFPQDLAAKFYHWKPSIHDPQFFVRTLVPREEALVHWRKADPNQLVFYRWDNEWDIYNSACDTETGLLDLLENGANFEREHPLPPCSEVIIQRASANTQTVDFGDEENCQAKLQKPVSFCLNDARDYVARRFGFLLPNDPPHFEAPRINPLCIGIQPATMEKLDARASLSILVTTHCILERHEPHLEKLLDIRAHRSALIDRGFKMKIAQVEDAEFMFRGVTKTHTLYLMGFPDDSDGWILGLRSAANVVFAIREGWCVSKSTIIHNFCLHGIEFYTLARLPLTTTSSLSLTDILVLPKLDKSIKQKEFAAYETRREAFLNTPDGRIAAKRGGMVSRLWRENNTMFTERLAHVRTGPSLKSLHGGVRVKLGEYGYFYDDELSETLDGYICGQYAQIARDNDWSKFDRKESWYSTNASFNSRRLEGASRWTENDEYKFLERSSSGNKLLSGQEWKNKSANMTKKLDTQYEAECARFLASYFQRNPYPLDRLQSL